MSNINVSQILYKYGQKNTFYTQEAMKEIIDAVVNECANQSSRILDEQLINGHPENVEKARYDVKYAIINVKKNITYE